MTRIQTINGAAASDFCFGCMQFGGAADASASREMFASCRTAGLNFFDVAHVYTGGEAERLLGAFAKERRDELIVATKAAYTGGAGRENILMQFDESRRRLDLDQVDILYLHRWDGETPLEESMETLAALQRSRAIRYIGVSNFAAWQVMKAQGAAAKAGTTIDIIQPMYSLIKRQAEIELFPMALSEGIAVAAYSPLGSGMLTGKYLNGGEGRLASDKRYAARYGQGWMRKTAADLADLAEKRDVDPATLAVAWAARHPAVTAPIISARSAEQLSASLAALEMSLSDADYSQISSLSPQPAPATDRLEEAAA